MDCDYGDLIDDEDEFDTSNTAHTGATDQSLLNEELMRDDMEERSIKVVKDSTFTTINVQSTPTGESWGPESDPHICCWWCCHKFDITPVTLPTSYNYKCDRWTFFGIFCSVACAKAYSMTEFRGGDMGLKSALLTKFMKQYHKLTPPFGIAPPRQALQMFGGGMDIHTFRKIVRLL
jgi:hypothetical protein